MLCKGIRDAGISIEGRAVKRAVGIALLLIMVVAGCGATLPEEPPNSYEIMAAVELYFAGAAAVNSGTGTETETETETEELYVLPVKRELAGGGDLLRRTLEELIKGPRPEDGDYFSTIPVTAQITGLELSDGVAVIDFQPRLFPTVRRQPCRHCFPAIAGSNCDPVSRGGKNRCSCGRRPWTDGHFLWEEPLGPDDL